MSGDSVNKKYMDILTRYKIRGVIRDYELEQNLCACCGSYVFRYDNIRGRWKLSTPFSENDLAQCQAHTSFEKKIACFINTTIEKVKKIGVYKDCSNQEFLQLPNNLVITWRDA